MAPGGTVDFELAARRVADRLMWRRALALANQTVLAAALGAAGAVVLGRQVAPESAAWGLAPLGLILWAAGCVAWAWKERPDAYGALAHWDSVSRTAGSLASAWWFRLQPVPGVGEQLHLREAEGILQRRVPDLAPEIPTGRPARTWWWLLLVPVILGSGLGRRSLSWDQRQLTEETKEVAAGLAQELSATREKLRDEKAGEVAEEIVKGGKLEDIMAGAEKLLAKPGGTTTGEMLDGLEDRARKIEELAQEFRGGNDWAPSALLEELERHADTAALAGEIREKHAMGGAAEAERLGDLAQTPGGAERLQQALESAVGKVDPSQGQSPVVRQLAEAETHLQARAGDQASDDFRELSEHFRDLARKDDARKELEALAAQLREGAEQLAGSTQENSRESAPANEPPPGAQALADQAPPPAAGESANPPPVPSGSGKSPSPGGNAAPLPGPPDAPVPGQANAPVPGTTAPPPSASLTLQAPVPGQAPTPAGPSLSAPVPGQPAPGAPGSTSGLQPGLNAGEGTAAMAPAPSKTLASARDDRVETKRGTEGDSETRSVQSNKVREEAATLATRAASGDFRSVEESAMDEQALPPGRRDQVRRYFNALRDRFEEEEAP